jgi:hypothetical protein
LKEPALAVDERVFEPNRDPCEPEKELLRNVLIRAVQDATGNVQIGDGDGRVEFEAVTWIYSNQGRSDTHITFLWICEWLEIDAARLRATIKAARADGVKLSISDLQTQRVARGVRFKAPWFPTRVSEIMPT